MGYFSQEEKREGGGKILLIVSGNYRSQIGFDIIDDIDEYESHDLFRLLKTL